MLIDSPTIDAAGVRHYRLESPHQRRAVEVRLVLPPGSPATGAARFLYILPVEPQGGTVYGDGLAVLRELDLARRHGLILVAPSFAEAPWYADHATDPARADETHLLEVVLPLVDRHCPARWPIRLLLGFSKSGWGALTLLLRHPDLFHGAAAWDAPLMQARPDRWEMPAAFGMEAQFARYQVTRLWRERADSLRPGKRLGLFGYSLFRDQLRQAHALLTDLGIPHDWADGPERAHTWSSGWVPEAVSALVKLGADGAAPSGPEGGGPSPP